MKQHKLVLALGAVLSVSFASALSAANPDPNRVIVQFTPGSKAAVANALRGAGARVHHELDIANAIAATVPPQALEGLRRNPNVEMIEVDAPRYALGETVPYGIPAVQADQAVAAGANGTGVKVCIIDSGIKQNHEDFAGIAMTGFASSGQSWSTDSCGHGTHVAGTIAAVGSNGKGVVGVSPGKVSLHIVKVFDGSSCAWSYASTLVNAAQNCQAAGAKIISMSLGGGQSSNTEKNAFANLNSAGILSIAAAGNDGNNRSSYPASYPSVMSVAAVDNTNTWASFSQYNSAVEIAAPGVGVLSTYPIREGSVTVGTTSYMAAAMEGSPAPATPPSGNLVDGGKCLSAGAWANMVVLCERGDIAFSDKVLNVQSGGGKAAIIYNNVSGGFGGTLNGVATTIPSVTLSQEDGQALVAGSLGSSATVDARTVTDANGYAYLDGTSMATPHVSGVAALLWSSKPSATNTEIRNAMTSTALDRGTAGRDNYYGYGVVQANAARIALGGSTGGNVAPTASFTYSCTNLVCSFNGSGSSDSDGSIASYSWSFGASGVTASNTFASAGSYAVTLTVTDNAGATGTSTQTVTVTSGGGGAISIGTALAFSKSGPNYKALGTATITSGGAAVSGATVTGCFTGAVTGCGTGTTGSGGTLTIQSGNFRTRAAVTFCVTNVNGTAYNQCTTATP